MNESLYELLSLVICLESNKVKGLTGFRINGKYVAHVKTNLSTSVSAAYFL